MPSVVTTPHRASLVYDERIEDDEAVGYWPLAIYLEVVRRYKAGLPCHPADLAENIRRPLDAIGADLDLLADRGYLPRRPQPRSAA